MNIEIKDFLEGNRDYSKGIELFNKYSKRKKLLKKFETHKGVFWEEKLFYELKQLSLVVPARIVVLTPSDNFTHKFVSESDMRKMYSDGFVHPADKQKYKIPFKELPDICKDLVVYKSKLFNKRSVLHREMRRLPEENIHDTIERRALLNTNIRAISTEIEMIYSSLREHENSGKLPLFKIVSDEIEPVIDKNKEISNKEISDLDLRKEYDNLVCSRRKDFLKVYGDDKKGKEPLPAGETLEAAKVRLESKNKKLEELKCLLIDKGLLSK